jgi:hypothetical protein
VLAQAVQAGSVNAPDLSRVRKALGQPPPAVSAEVTERADGPLFRVTILARKPEPPPWANWNGSVPTYVRPSFPIYHFEFLTQVTPEYFRASVLYPGMIGFDIVPIIQKIIEVRSKARHRAQETAARAEVQEALEQLNACRANPRQPGC